MTCTCIQPVKGNRLKPESTLNIQPAFRAERHMYFTSHTFSPKAPWFLFGSETLHTLWGSCRAIPRF